MTPVPLTLPLRPSEATELASLVFELAERRPLTDEIRNRIAARLVPLHFESFTPHMGSLARDPVHHSTYYVAVDVADAEAPPQLLHMALATAPTSSVFHKPLLIGRVRRAGGPEIVINAIAFGPSNVETLEKFVTRVDSALLPRPLGSRAVVVAAPADPAAGMAAAFEAFRKIFKRTGRNLAAVETVPQSFVAGLYAAVRAGWREGYSSAVTFRAVDTGRDDIREAARFTRFRIDVGDLIADEPPAAGFTPEEHGWILQEFVRPLDVGGVIYDLPAPEAIRLAIRLGPALKAAERLHEWIREARAATKAGKSFDFELALPRASTAELVFCLHWLKAREHPAQSIAPGTIPEDAMEPTLREFSTIARHYGALLTIDSLGGHTGALLETIARATSGRVNYRVTGGAGKSGAYTEELIRIAEALSG